MECSNKRGLTKNLLERFVQWDDLDTSFKNSVCWNKCYSTIGVYDAVAHFSIGAKASIEIFKAYGMNTGVFGVAGVSGADRLIVPKANHKAKERNKVRRKVITGRNRTNGDKDESKEGKTYGASSFCALISVKCLCECNLFLVKSYVETMTAIY